MPSSRNVFTLVATLALAGASPAAWGADGPVSTPAAPTAPGENDLARAKRDVDKAVNDAGRAAGNGAPVDKQVDQQVAAAKRDAAAADASTAEDVRPPGTTRPSAVTDADGVRQVVANVVALATSPDHMDRLTQRLAQPDRDRLRGQPGYAGRFGPDLDAATVRLSAAWEARYGHPFTSAGAAAAITDAFADVQQGAATGPSPDPKAMAHVTVAASHGLPAVTIELVRETPDGWKLDVPDTLDVDTLRKNLSDEVGAVVATTDHWPATEADAYRAVTHRVLLAMMGQPLPPQ